MNQQRTIDKQRVRRRFERIARRYDAHAVLQREVAARMLEGLDLVRLDPRVVIDLGSGTGTVARALQARYPKALAIALDLSPAMLRAGQGYRSAWSRLRGSGPQPVCADMERLPLGPQSVDLVCSSLALAWSNDPASTLAEAHRVLDRGGLFMFATLGPDSLEELRAANGGCAPHASPFVDMHDLGDLLLNVGFADPVMEMESIAMTYPTLRALLEELKAGGGSGIASPHMHGLRGRRWLHDLESRYEPMRREGRYPLSFEIVYGHAWKPESGPRRTADGRAVIHFEPSQRIPRRGA